MIQDVLIYENRAARGLPYLFSLMQDSLCLLDENARINGLDY
jgi:hypothetical protein